MGLVRGLSVCRPGQVDVTNEIHNNPAEHQYVVTLDDVAGDAMAGTCPHHVHHHAYWKHGDCVETAAINGNLDAFLSKDDETDDSDDTAAATDRGEPPEDCKALGGFPCWACVKTGRMEIPK